MAVSGGAQIWTVKAWSDLRVLESAPMQLRRWGESLVSETCGQIQAEARANLARNGSIRTGDLWRSIQLTGSGARMGVEANAFYAGYVEYGTRFMAAKPYFTPAVEKARRTFNDAARSRLVPALLGRVPTAGAGIRSVRTLIPRTARGGPF